MSWRIHAYMVTPLIYLLRNRTTQYFNRVTLGILDYHIITPFTLTYFYRKHCLERSLLIFFCRLISTPLSLHDIILLLFFFFYFKCSFIYRTNTYTTYNTKIILSYIYIYIARLILTLFIQTNRTNTYATYNTNIILTFTFTVYTSTNYNIYNTITNHLIRLQLAYLHF